MKAFAEIKDLEARWRPLDASEYTRAGALLTDASVKIATECAQHGIDYEEPADLLAANLKIVCCEMVKRALLASIDQAPITQGSTTVGPFAESFTYANPTGDLYMTKKERQSLGIGLQRVGFVYPWGDA